MNRLRHLSISSRLAWLFALVAWLVFGAVGLALHQLLARTLVHEREHAQRTKLQVVAQRVEQMAGGSSVPARWTDTVAPQLAALHQTDRSTYFWVFCESPSGAACSPDVPALRAAANRRQWQAVRFEDAGVVPMGEASGATLRAMGLQLSGPGDAPRVDVVLASDDAQIYSTLRVYAWWIALCTLLGGLVTALLGWAGSRWALQPVQQLSRAAQALGPADLARRLNLPPPGSELHALALAFNGALARLEDAFRQLETFTADVAHELRSPLGTLIGATEVALSRPRSAAELGEVLAGNLADLERLAQLVRDMLFLARADHGERAAELRLVDLRHLAEDTAEFFQPLLEQHGTRIDLHGAGHFMGNAGLLKRALSNLIANAIQYGQAGQPVQVRIDTKVDELWLSVGNTGPALSAEVQAHMFDRFYRGDAARSRHSRQSGHSGLGLAIVQAIARMHEGRAFVRCGDGQVVTGLVLPMPGKADPSAHTHRVGK